MASASRPVPPGRLSFALLWLVLAGTSPASAADIAAEHEQLAAVLRQLDLADRLVEQAEHTAPEEHARYHFDYLRLRADLKSVRTGMQDYLVPQRAQPRDPVPLSGDYTREEGSSGQHGNKDARSPCR